MMKGNLRNSNNSNKMQLQRNNNVKDEQQFDENDNIRKMFLGGLAPNLSEDSLRSFYRKFGEVLDLKIMRDPESGRPRGFGFITFADPSSVDRAQAARPHIVDGKTVDSKRVLARGDVPKSNPNASGRKIFVGGLKDVHNEENLKDYFKQFGSVYNVKIVIDKNTGRKRGFAYIDFEDYDSADKAVLKSNHSIKHVPVDVKKSNYTQELARRNQSQNDHMHPSQSGGPPPSAYPPGPYPPAPYPPPYGYPPYGGWGAPPAPYPGQPPVPPYGAQPPPPPPYGAQPPPPPPAYGAHPPNWNGWGYGAPPAGGPPPQNGHQSQQNNNYQKSYGGGGPQRGGRLQNYRNNPYKS